MILSASAFSVAASRSRRAVLISFIAFITCGNGAHGRMPRSMAPTKGKGEGGSSTLIMLNRGTWQYPYVPSMLIYFHFSKLLAPVIKIH